jgi:hypothetical protein
MGPDCSSDWPITGQVTIDRTEFFFVLQQESKQFIGSVVRDSLVIIFPGGFQPPLFGKIDPSSITLTDIQGQCKMVLAPATSVN